MWWSLWLLCYWGRCGHCGTLWCIAAAILVQQLWFHWRYCCRCAGTVYHCGHCGATVVTLVLLWWYWVTVCHCDATLVTVVTAVVLWARWSLWYHCGCGHCGATVSLWCHHGATVGTLVVLWSLRCHCGGTLVPLRYFSHCGTVVTVVIVVLLCVTVVLLWCYCGATV